MLGFSEGAFVCVSLLNHFFYWPAILFKSEWINCGIPWQIPFGSKCWEELVGQLQEMFNLRDIVVSLANRWPPSPDQNLPVTMPLPHLPPLPPQHLALPSASQPWGFRAADHWSAARGLQAVAAAAEDTIPGIAKKHCTNPCTNDNLKHLTLLPTLSKSAWINYFYMLIIFSKQVSILYLR
jgi:hypothetical protein